MDEDVKAEALIVEETAAAAEADDQWVEGLWQATFPMLTCRMCQWDTLDGMEAALAHKATCPRCGPPPPPAPVEGMVLVADRHGREITEALSSTE